MEKSWGYAQLQQTRPLRPAIGLTDSPVGLAMWIYDSVRPDVMDPAKIWTPDRIITWTMMPWIGRPYGAFSLYKNGAEASPTSQSFFMITVFCMGRGTGAVFFLLFQVAI